MTAVVSNYLEYLILAHTKPPICKLNTGVADLLLFLYHQHCWSSLFGCDSRLTRQLVSKSPVWYMFFLEAL